MKSQRSKKKRLTVRELLDSDLIGMWENRTDITDSSIYARQLRKQAQTRGLVIDLTTIDISLFVTDNK